MMKFNAQVISKEELEDIRIKIKEFVNNNDVLASIITGDGISIHRKRGTTYYDDKNKIGQRYTFLCQSSNPELLSNMKMYGMNTYLSVSCMNSESVEFAYTPEEIKYNKLSKKMRDEIIHNIDLNEIKYQNDYVTPYNEYPTMIDEMRENIAYDLYFSH